MPPWLWVWLAGYLFPVVMPGQISGIRSVVTGFAWTWPPHSWTLSTVALSSSIFGLLVSAMVAAGVLGVMFPHLRGRWVERRFRLASQEWPVMTEMQQFVHDHDPSIQLRASIRGGQMARIYPVGWRSARIAVFRPLTVLWRQDRTVAEAILLHEVAHRRQGDQLIVGLGSPFVWLIRICVPAYFLLVLIPAVVYAGGGSLATALTVLVIPSAIFLPVIALWLAEIGADRQAAQDIGSDALQKALRKAAGPGASLTARAITLLSHPPRWLRLRCATASPAGAIALMAAWPVAVVLFFLISFGMNVPALFSDLPPRLRDNLLQVFVGGLADQVKPLIIATAVVLLAWPALTVAWQRLWSSQARFGRHQPWWPHLATASLPASMLLLSFLVPTPPRTQEVIRDALTKGPQAECSTIADWALEGHQVQYGIVSAEFIQLLQDLRAGEGERVIAIDARRLDAAILVALDNPPPGAAHSPYMQAMTHYRTAAHEYAHGNIPAGSKAFDRATIAYSKCEKVFADCL